MRVGNIVSNIVSKRGEFAAELIRESYYECITIREFIREVFKEYRVSQRVSKESK